MVPGEEWFFFPEVLRNKSSARLFADDCVLYRKVNSEEDAKALQSDLNSLQGWERDWMMEFHPGKCQVIHLTTKRTILKHKYTIHGEQLQQIDVAKYLGVQIHENLSWNSHINATAKKANKTLAFVRRNIYQCLRYTKEHCYKTLVRPIMEYGGVVWDPYTQQNIDQLEKV